MRYPGSKARYVPQLREVIEQYRGDRDYYLEPFLGGGNSFAAIAPSFRIAAAGDAHADIVALWQAVADGWVPPEHVTEDEYRAAKTMPPCALRGFIGSGCSFGGKWFGGYARGGFNADGTPRDHQAESHRAVMKKALAFHGRTIVHTPYDSWTPDKHTVVYCDPPYAGTLEYSVNQFDHEHFWKVMDSWADSGALVLVSEQTAPDGWVPVQTFSRRSSTALAHERPVTQEHIFIRKEQTA